MFRITRRNPAPINPSPSVAVEVAIEYPELASFGVLYRFRVGSESYLFWSVEHPMDVEGLLEFLAELPASLWANKPVLDYPWPLWIRFMKETEYSTQMMTRLDDAAAETRVALAELTNVEWWARPNYVDECIGEQWYQYTAMAQIAADDWTGRPPEAGRCITYLQSVTRKYQEATAEAKLIRNATADTNLESLPPTNDTD